MKNRFSALIAAVLCAAGGAALASMPSSMPIPMKMNVLFIVDSSGSMWGQVDGKPKYESTREVMDGVLQTLPRDASLGLLSYGHRRANDCTDIELIAPIGSKNSAEIQKITTTLTPRGITPLSSALSTAAETLRVQPGAKMIVLLTDGGEECSGDPCEVARQLANSGFVVRVNVVGLSLEPKEREQLECIAREGGGRYFEVKDKETLFKAVGEISKDIETMPKAPEPVAPPQDLNLLLPGNGGRIIGSNGGRWENSISGYENNSTLTSPKQEVVFAFKDNKRASFSRFALSVPQVAPYNIREFELQVADSADGPYRSLGQFTAQNALKKPSYQEFTFAKTSAHYFKFIVLSNYGFPMQKMGNTQVFQLQLFGMVEEQ